MILCSRDTANPPPILTLKKNGIVQGKSTSNHIYVNTSDADNIKNYTCEAQGGRIDGVLHTQVQNNQPKSEFTAWSYHKIWEEANS